MEAEAVKNFLTKMEAEAEAMKIFFTKLKRKRHQDLPLPKHCLKEAMLENDPSIRVGRYLAYRHFPLTLPISNILLVGVLRG